MNQAEELQAIYDFVYFGAHEAAHAVVAHELGLRVKAIELQSSVGGEAFYSNDTDKPTEAEAVMALAGAIASEKVNDDEKEANNRRRWRDGLPMTRLHWSVPSDGDEEIVSRYLHAHYFHGLSAAERNERQRLEGIARQMVARSWGRIMDVVLALHEKEERAGIGSKVTMSRAEFLAAIGEGAGKTAASPAAAVNRSTKAGDLAELRKRYDDLRLYRLRLIQRGQAVPKPLEGQIAELKAAVDGKGGPEPVLENAARPVAMRRQYERA